MKPNVPKQYRRIFYETAKQKVLEHLFRFPDKEFSLSDLAKDAGVSKSNIGVILKEFHDFDIIKIIQLSKIWRIKANQQNWFFLRSKMVFNLNFIYQSGLVEFLNEFYKNPKAIILFGSFRRGDDITSSDIDIAIEVDEECESAVLDFVNVLKAEKKDKEAELVNSIEKEIKRKFQLFIFNRKNVDLHVFNNIANGIVLYGFLEVRI
jgi:predicted nucleotidyltransferase